MSNPKEMHQKPECGFNEYQDKAKADARAPTGWSWIYIGPRAGAPKPPIGAPPPKPLAGAALKKLRTEAEKNARERAKHLIATISAYPCPPGCKKKVDLDSNFFDEPYFVGQPWVRFQDWPDQLFFAGAPPNLIPMIVRIRLQEWVQDAEQKYHVHFSCVER